MFFYTTSCNAEKKNITVWGEGKKEKCIMLSKPQLCRQPEVFFGWGNFSKQIFSMYLSCELVQFPKLIDVFSP